jgi:hypothetical protein
VALVELGGMAEGEGLVEIFLGAILCGCEGCLEVVLERNGFGEFGCCVVGLDVRLVGRSLAPQAPAGFLPKCARVP